MKKNLLKNIGIIALAMAICFLPEINTFASIIKNGEQIIFAKQYVDSNEWTYICSIVESTESTELEVDLWSIYKANGESSTYSRVKMSPCFGNTLKGSVTIKVGETKVFSIPSGYKKAGNYYKLYAMGNNPALDCQITGVLSAQ